MVGSGVAEGAGVTVCVWVGIGVAVAGGRGEVAGVKVTVGAACVIGAVQPSKKASKMQTVNNLISKDG